MFTRPGKHTSLEAVALKGFQTHFDSNKQYEMMFNCLGYSNTYMNMHNQDEFIAIYGMIILFITIYTR